MITKDACGKNEVYGIYDLMGHQVRSRRGGNRVKGFLDAYHNIRDTDIHEDLQNNLIGDVIVCV
jgi:hypothetical protein